MSARAPGQHPAEGETNQEHKIEHQKDQLADDQAQLADDHGRQSPAKRETWADWFPDIEATETLDRLVELASSHGVDVDRTTIRFWQTQGILPHPVRRRFDRGVYAMYPTLAITLIERIREMQADGLTLKEIGPRIRGHAMTLSTSSRTVPQSANISVTGDPGPLSLSGHARGTSTTWGELTITAPDPLEISPQIAEIAKKQETMTGIPVQRVEITFIDEHHRRTTYEFSAADRWE